MELRRNPRVSPAAAAEVVLEIRASDPMETLKMPSDAQLIQIVIGVLNNASLPVEDRLRSLQELLILEEPTYNANDLNKLGRLAVIIRELDHPEFDVRKLSAWVVGKVLELGALAKLMMMVKSEFVEEAIKELYTVSALIQNNLSGQELFYAEVGDLIIQDILSNATVTLRRKAVFLVGDLAEFQLEATGEGEIPFFSNRHLLKSVVGLMTSGDLDLQEKGEATTGSFDWKVFTEMSELTFQKKLGMETQQVPT